MIGAVIALLLLTPGCYQPPVESPIVDPFRAPECPFCRGNRGLEYQPPSGSPVVAAADGVVTFSGVVAGVRYVVTAGSSSNRMVCEPVSHRLPVRTAVAIAGVALLALTA